MLLPTKRRSPQFYRSPFVFSITGADFVSKTYGNKQARSATTRMEGARRQRRCQKVVAIALSGDWNGNTRGATGSCLEVHDVA